MNSETVLVDCEKVVLKRLDGIYEICWAQAEFIKDGGSLEWVYDDGSTKIGTHVSCLRNNHLIYKEEKQQKTRLFT